MTMRDSDLHDPKLREETLRDAELRAEMTASRAGNGWMWGMLAVLLILGAVAFAWNGGPDTTASNTNATAPATTSGSGSSGPAPNAPSGNPAAR
jgi:hypothetical protein